MKLFSKIYTYLLLGIIGMLIIDGNVNYEAELKQFDIDMADNARQIGWIVSGMISHTWQESGPEKAIQLIDDANRADHLITIRWVWLDELKTVHGQVIPELQTHLNNEISSPFSFTALNEHRQEQRYTFMAVDIPGDRPGAIQLTQSLVPREKFIQRMLIRSLSITTLLALISGIIIYFFIHIKIRGPLEKLSSKAVEIGKGNLMPDLEIKGEDELVGLAGIMNDMCTRLLIAKEKIHFEHLARLKTLEQLRHTEKLSTVGQIAAGIAHEIGTPLNVVDGRAKMIISEPLEPDEIISCARIIKTQAERMTLIIRQLLDYSRKKKSHPKTLENVETVLRQVFRLLSPMASKQGITLTLHTVAEIQMVCRMDAQQMQQVFMNVIMNAIQATPNGKEVVVEIVNTTLKSMLHTDDQMKKLVRIDVLDEGDGIPEDQLPEIFTPFYTTKQIGLGTGLGLSIARELLEEHNGWIEVENRRPKGARFSIFLLLEETEQ
ncbi:HAMP domain-containing histidine kinase [Desulfopila sp. IMCC35006]|uniref:sensor histidine kinase n=1 Tax=Desulfopila sp. IMCC35006 TaxID=2569542 RepID=UPI0010AD74F9|nr:HAMP domain-containing sensor histidine kinase [Desulfopila sp. IMCC35006]TKB26948.1 HAMP domain-containing histidine kinase [Desulfopila sp. IMCC35006]